VREIDWQKFQDGEDFGTSNLLVCVESLKEAKDALKTEMFDMIFLDYLLGEKDGDGRELGSELLKEIQEKEDLRKNIGPLNKFWIFPISAFSYAMMDELREQGYGYLGDYWHISGGADPINTPWLFKYKLVKFLSQQLSSLLPKERMKKNGIQDILFEFLNNVFYSDDNVSKSAKDSYNDFLDLKGKYEILLEDKYKKSFLAGNLVEIEQEKAEKLFEHLHYLIYLLAYGSPVEWEMMWEEYVYIRNFLANDGYLIKVENPLKSIKRYIVDCQKMYR